jgi:hypothetical protein
VQGDGLGVQPLERLKVYLFGATVLFASFGMGEATYRILFSEFDGATDRIPIEALFGLVFARMATTFVNRVFRNREERSARLTSLGFCGDQTALFPLDQMVSVNFNPGQPCATVIVVIIVV